MVMLAVVSLGMIRAGVVEPTGFASLERGAGERLGPG